MRDNIRTMINILSAIVFGNTLLHAMEKFRYINWDFMQVITLLVVIYWFYTTCGILAFRFKYYMKQREKARKNRHYFNYVIK